MQIIHLKSGWAGVVFLVCFAFVFDKLPSFAILCDCRPISLVNTVYKIYAALLHNRIKEAIDQCISPYQFGFRAGRSTSTPLFVIRRLLEIHERHGVSFYALFLDWAQAFDSVTHAALKLSLARIGISDHYIQCIMAIYSNATIRVREGNIVSKSYSFKRGIRQGCPLSPYLFVIVLSVLVEDLYSHFRSLYQVLPSVLSHDRQTHHRPGVRG